MDAETIVRLRIVRTIEGSMAILVKGERESRIHCGALQRNEP